MNVRNNLRRDFTQTPNELINNDSISRHARFLFVWLCSKPDNWEFYSQGVNKALGCKDDARRKYMKELYDTGWIDVCQKRNPDGSWAANDIILNSSPVLPVSEKIGDGKKPEPVKNGDGKNPTHSNTIDNNNTLKKEINNTKESLSLFQSDAVTPEDDFKSISFDLPSLPEEILQYLNEKKGGKKGFEIKSASNQIDIKARIKEKKYTLEDFKKVIDFKVSEWKNDPKTRQWLRPETLFGKKFNGYLINAEDSKDNLTAAGGSQNFVDSVSSSEDLL